MFFHFGWVFPPEKSDGEKPKNKNELKNNLLFAPFAFGDSLTSNIIVGYSFDINIYAPRVGSIPGHYTLATAGCFFKKCSEF